jgi:8-oxo-dGTP diphosphatase
MPKPVTPRLTVDVVIEMKNGIVLIERKHPPKGWALPGGFVDVGETVENAAQREAKEETGLTVRNLKLLGVYSDPKRDPRGHTVSAVFVGRAAGVPKGADDATRAVVADPRHPPRPLAFDHARILRDYLRWK